MDGCKPLGAERFFSPESTVLRIAVGSIRGVADEPDHHQGEAVDVGCLRYRCALHVQSQGVGEVGFDKGELGRGG